MVRRPGCRPPAIGHCPLVRTRRGRSDSVRCRARRPRMRGCREIREGPTARRQGERQNNPGSRAATGSRSTIEAVRPSAAMAPRNGRNERGCPAAGAARECDDTPRHKTAQRDWQTLPRTLLGSGERETGFEQIVRDAALKERPSELRSIGRTDCDDRGFDGANCSQLPSRRFRDPRPPSRSTKSSLAAGSTARFLRAAGRRSR